MISAACVVWISLIVPTFGLGYYGQPSGALWADQLFVATSGNVLPGSKCGSVYRGTLRRDEHMPRSPIEYWDHSAVAPLVRCPQTKLEVRENRVLWYTAGGEPLIMPFTELPCLEANNFGDELCRLRHGFPHPRWLISKYTGSVDLMLFPEHRKPDVPEPPIPVDPNTAQSAAATRTKRQLDYRYRARTDLQIAGPKSVRLFHAYASFIYISVEPDYLDEWRLDPKTKQLAKNLPPPPNRQLRTGKLPADFTERFAAYTSAKRDYT